MGRQVIKAPSPLRYVDVDAAAMRTMDTQEASETDTQNVEGAFIRLQPLVGDTPDALQDLKRSLLSDGAIGVKILPPPKVEDAVRLDDKRGDCPMCGGDGHSDDGPDMGCDRCGGTGDDPIDDGRSLREVVHARAARARNVDDPKALTEALDEALDAAGL